MPFHERKLVRMICPLFVALLTFQNLALSQNPPPNKYQLGVNHAMNQAMYHAYLAGKGKNSDSKMHKYMAMMQMMQANATALAGIKSRKEDDKNNSAKASPSPTPSPNPQLEIAKLEIPQLTEEKPLIDFTKPLERPEAAPNPNPPMPAINEGVLPKLLLNMKPTEKNQSSPQTNVSVASDSSSKTNSSLDRESTNSKNAAKAPNSASEGPSKIPDTIAQRPLREENSDSNHLPAASRGITSLGAVPPPQFSVAVGGQNNTSDPNSYAANVTAPPIDEQKTKSPNPEAVYGTSSADSDRSSSRSGSSGWGDLFGDYLDMKVPGPSADEQIVMPEAQESAGSNIFEYATYRFRHTEVKRKSSKKRS